MQVMAFRDQYVEGRETLGVAMPPDFPPIYQYVYRAGALLTSRGGGR